MLRQTACTGHTPRWPSKYKINSVLRSWVAQHDSYPVFDTSSRADLCGPCRIDVQRFPLSQVYRAKNTLALTDSEVGLKAFRGTERWARSSHLVSLSLYTHCFLCLFFRVQGIRNISHRKSDQRNKFQFPLSVHRFWILLPFSCFPVFLWFLLFFSFAVWMLAKRFGERVKSPRSVSSYDYLLSGLTFWAGKKRFCIAIAFANISLPFYCYTPAHSVKRVYWFVQSASFYVAWTMSNAYGSVNTWHN